MKKMMITALILALSALVFTSCLDKKPGGAGDQAGTSDESTAEPMTTDNVTSDSTGITETQPITDIGTADSKEITETQGMTDIGTADSEEITGTQGMTDIGTADSEEITETQETTAKDPETTSGNTEDGAKDHANVNDNIEFLPGSVKPEEIMLIEKVEPITEDEISKIEAYYLRFGDRHPISWFQEDQPTWYMRYYGKINGYVILCDGSLEGIPEAVSYHIGASQIRFRSGGSAIYAYKDGKFTNIADAYKSGQLSDENIALIEKRHNGFEGKYGKGVIPEYYCQFKVEIKR